MVRVFAPRRVLGIRAIAVLIAASTLSCGEARPDASRQSRQPTTTYSFSIVKGSLPRVLFMDRERGADLVLRNDGFNAWEGDRTFFLSPRWFDVRGSHLLEEGFRTPVPGGTGPGEEVRVTVRVKPPGRYGFYRVQWDLLSDSSGWFHRFDRTPEPPTGVLVLPPLEFFLAVLLPCLVLGAAVAIPRRTGLAGSGVVAAFLGAFDLVWCAASLFGKPFVLYVELPTKFSPGPKPITFSVVAFLLLLVYYLPARPRRLAAWALAALGALVVWAQTIYFRFFLDLGSSVAALAGGQATDLGESISFLAKPTDLWLTLDLLLAVPILLWPPKAPGRRITRRRPAVAFALAICAIPFVWSGANALSSRQLQARRNLQNLRAVSAYGLYGFQLLDAGTRVAEHWTRPDVTPEEFDLVLEWFEKTRPRRQATPPHAGLAQGLNLIAIQVESMQEFVVDFEVDGVPVMPNLRRRRRTALEFPMMLDQTSRGRSSAGDFVALTSMIPVGESIAYEYPKNDYYALAHALSDREYSTLSAIPYKGSFWNRRITHASYGFETNLFRSDFERREPRVGWGINDRDFLGQMVPILDSLDEPFFAWLTTLSVHYPYESFPSELQSRSMGALEGSRLGNYLHGMSLLDRALEDFLDALEAGGLADRTVVAVWGDHGSGLIRDQHFIDYFGLDTSVKKFLFGRVPFMIWLPPDRAFRRIEPVPAGQVDIAPTLLALLGVEPADIALMGRNLLQDPVRGRVVHPQAKWLDSELVYLSQFAETEGACWSAKALRPVPPGRCERGSIDADRQLEVVSLVLRHDLQAEVSRRLTRSRLQDKKNRAGRFRPAHPN